MIAYAPFYRPWTARNLEGWLLNWNRAYITRDATSCSLEFKAAARVVDSVEWINRQHVPYPFRLERQA